ncbi:MAG: hypothetical protein M3T49_00055, partial [Candidatus Eremiobacteraeota bacterium]|nr:hypothetical protein [Candidatus Eremiobacteraeota bacterium]
SKMVCDAYGLHLTDPINGKTRTFPLTVRIARENGFMWAAVRPGQSVPWPLRRDLRLGIAHLEKR